MTLEELFFVIIIFILGLLVVYLKSYTKEKGRNLATKQDIEEITNKIEAVKSQYSVEIEKLKSYLQIAVANQFSIQEKKHESILKFYEDCMILFNEKLNYRMGDLPPNPELIMEYQTELNHLFIEILLDYYNLLLYFNPEDKILIISNNMVNNINDIKKIFKKDFWGLKKAILNEYDAVETGKEDHIKRACDSTDRAGKKYYDKMNPVTQIGAEILSNLTFEVNKYFKELNYERSIEKISKKK